MEKMAHKCETINVAYEKYRDGGEKNSFPYDRHEDNDNITQRLFNILGENTRDEVNYVNDAHKFSFTKIEVPWTGQKREKSKQRQEDNEKGDLSEIEKSIQKDKKGGKKEKHAQAAKKNMNGENEDNDDNDSLQNKAEDSRILRKEWINFLKLWIDESRLFHSNFPKSMHQPFFELRVKKLAIVIYHYLHEKSTLYIHAKQYHEEQCDPPTAPSDWMDGSWFPNESMIDPASETNRIHKSAVFSLASKNKI
jgi:hypothetical protein